MRTTLVAILAVSVLVCAGCGGRQTQASSANPTVREKKIQYSGGAGTSADDAVVILNARSQKEGVSAEYDFISRAYGQQGKSWRLQNQSIVREGEKVFDMIEFVETSSDVTHYIYFDLTNCVWKPKKSSDQEPRPEAEEQESE